VAALGGPDEEAKPRPFLLHSFEEHSAQFSPADAGGSPRWLAYTSRETGQHEVYVRDFPEGRHKWQVSSQGGLQPQWRRDGRELIYVKLDGTLTSVPVNRGPNFEFGASESLFMTGFRFLLRYSHWWNQLAVSRDGQRFLVNRPVPEAAQSAITAVIPW